LSNLYTGFARTMGVAQKSGARVERWGEATTAHQAAQQQQNNSRFYKYFAPTALFAVLVLGFGVFRASNSHASTSLAGQSPQQQMQFPEGLDYSKFQHDSRYHARLPCLLCHRRDSNAAVPKLPGASQHLPCAGCHAQQFASTDGPICTICHTEAKS